MCVLPSFVNACVYIYYRNNGGEMKSGSHITHSMRPLYFSLSLSFLQAVRESANKFQHFFCARSQPSKRITDNYPARQNSNTRNDMLWSSAHTHITAKATGQPRTGQRNGNKKPRATPESEKDGFFNLHDVEMHKKCFYSYVFLKIMLIILLAVTNMFQVFKK